MKQYLTIYQEGVMEVAGCLNRKKCKEIPKSLNGFIRIPGASDYQINAAGKAMHYCQMSL